MTWVLEGFNTDARYGEVRHREYTTSDRKAEMFNQIPKIQFTDSGHGIVFHARKHSGPRLPTIHMDYVRTEMRRLAEEQRVARRATKRPSRAEVLAAQLQEERELRRAAMDRVEELEAAIEHARDHIGEYSDPVDRILAAALDREVPA